MGGDTVSLLDSSINDEDLSTINHQFLDRSSEIPNSRPGGLSAKTTEENESVFTESDARSFRNLYKKLETNENEIRTHSLYAQVLMNYDELKHRAVNMEVAKSKILSYTPGSWVENVGGMTMNDYNLPKTTTLLLIGPKGSGKSSLINRISRVFEDDKFAPERAQVTYNSSIGNGTSFLHEYMIPRNSTSFCLYDTRSLSIDSFENLEMIKHWMTKGVCHKELVKSSSLQARMKLKAHQDKFVSYERRTVNFVIFVVNGLSVLKCLDSNGADTQYTEMVSEVFSSPFLCFKDHKPAIAITHGDLLSLSERARVRVYLGELLGVHPSKQTFEIPDNYEPTTEMTIVDLVRYALEHADRNLPCKSRPLISKGHIIQLWTCLLLLLTLGMFLFTIYSHGFSSVTSVKVHAESVHEPRLEIKKVITENVPEPCLEIKKVITESVPKPGLETKKVITESVTKPSLEIKKVITESVPKPGLETKKVITESVTKPSLEIKKVITESVPKPGLETKKVITESVPKPGLETKKVITESVTKPSLEIKKVHVEKQPIKEVHRGRNSESRPERKKVGAGRVREPSVEIDWKKIRHLWYV